MFATPLFMTRNRVLRRWCFSLLRRYAKLTKPRFVVERRMGALMLLDQRDKVDLHLLCGGFWEADRIEYLHKLILAARQGRRTVFLDIGAHGALYSLVLDKRLNFDRIVIFEPEPIALAQIGANVMMNGLGERTEIVAKAVSSSSGVARFIVAHDSNRGQSRMAGSQEPAAPDALIVEVMSIDEMIRETDTLLVAKIDVEGHENEVLLGMREATRKNDLILQVEKNGDDLSRLERLLNGFGMKRIHSIGQDHYFVKAGE